MSKSGSIKKPSTLFYLLEDIEDIFDEIDSIT